MKKNIPKKKPSATAIASVMAALAFSSSLLVPDAQAVGVHKLSLTTNPGSSKGNFISAPLLDKRVWRGQVASVAGSTITVDGITLPADLGRKEADGTAPGTLPALADFAQYVVIVRWDASATFPSTGVAGDWWLIDSSTGTTLTVTPGVQGPSVSMAAGDRIEVVPLASLRDLFGGPGGPTTILNKDFDGAADINAEDVIFFMGGSLGLNFATTIIFIDGSVLGTEGYIVNGELSASSTPFNGSFITVTPDQAFFVFRKFGTANVKGFNAGHTHRAPLTHYCLGSASGPYHTGIGTGFPVNAPIGPTALQSTTGFVFDTDGAASAADEDLLLEVGGTSGTGFTSTFFCTTAFAPSPPTVWVYDNGPLIDDNTPVLSGRGYFLSRKSGTTAPLIWREPAPFKL